MSHTWHLNFLDKLISSERKSHAAVTFNVCLRTSHQCTQRKASCSLDVCNKGSIAFVRQRLHGIRQTKASWHSSDKGSMAFISAIIIQIQVNRFVSTQETGNKDREQNPKPTATDKMMITARFTAEKEANTLTWCKFQKKKSGCQRFDCQFRAIRQTCWTTTKSG